MPPPPTPGSPSSRSSISRPLLAGVVSGLVGFTSSFAVVISGLTGVGATPAQAASGLLVLCLTMGVGSLLFSWRTRMPVTMAWSTPGAALLATTAAPAGGFPTAVGAFVVSGVLLTLCGLLPPLARAVQAIPTAVANAMLAGVLLSICVQPVAALVATPAAIAPVVGVWLVLLRLAPRWAVPGALVAAVVVLVVTGSVADMSGPLLPHLEVVTPRWDLTAVVSIGVPLFLVTMTSQNVAGLAVLGSFGYRPRVGPVLGYTGAASALGALGGAHAINLAAISAALSAGPEAGPDRDRRWLAGVACGALYLVLGPLSALVGSASAAAPAGLLTTIAGLALVGTFAAAAGAALTDGDRRLPAAVTFVVAAAGISVAGIGAAFWALLAGLVVGAVTRPR